jgi:hypothetical protein
MPRKWPLPAALVVAAVLGAEAYLLFVNRDGTFRIEGEQPYAIEAFAAGERVRQAFLMQGAGLRAVRVLVEARADGPLPIAWKLWRGLPDTPDMTLAFEGIETVMVRRGREWIEFEFTRDGSSGDKWYTFEIAPAGPPPANREAAPMLMASHDNPDRGGALWVGDARQPRASRDRCSSAPIAAARRRIDGSDRKRRRICRRWCRARWCKARFFCVVTWHLSPMRLRRSATGGRHQRELVSEGGRRTYA